MYTSYVEFNKLQLLSYFVSEFVDNQVTVGSQ